MSPSPKRGQFWRIFLGTILLSIAYGILHDMVTAHVAVQYFTEYHPHLVDSKSPIVMALLWGVVATWWFGAMAGLVIGIADVVGKSPIVPAHAVLKLAGKALLVVLALAMLVLVFSLALKDHMPRMMDDYFYDEAPSLRLRLGSVGNAHLFSYAGCLLAVIWVCVSIAVQRRRLRFASSLRD